MEVPHNRPLTSDALGEIGTQYLSDGYRNYTVARENTVTTRVEVYGSWEHLAGEDM